MLPLAQVIADLVIAVASIFPWTVRDKPLLRLGGMAATIATATLLWEGEIIFCLLGVAIIPLIRYKYRLLSQLSH